MAESQIVIRPSGRMANRMFQLMLASEIRKRAGVGRIVGYHLPRWGLESPPIEPLLPPYVVLKEHMFDLDHISYLLRSGMVSTIVIVGWGMRLAYYGSASQYRELFRTSAQGYQCGDDELLIHVRADDILDLHHPHYFPMPFSYYESVISATRLRPVFMGQLGVDRYSEALRRHFSSATFLPSQSALEDFTTIRHARHIALSVSSFSWLAAWLSETALNVHMPIFGLFDPRNLQKTFLLPLNDGRYTFHAVDVPGPEARAGLDVVAWAQKTEAAGTLSHEQVQQLAISALP